MTASHTPGPWKIGSVTGEDGTVFNPSYITTHDDQSIGTVFEVPLHCTLRDIEHSGTWDEGLANARLFATAPELLAAAEAVESAIQGLRLDPALKEATDYLYEIIVKARGKP